MKIYSIGDICLDILCSVSEHAALGEEKRLRDLTFSLGGNAANFSFAASKLGLNAEFMSVLGTDFASEFLLNQLKKAGIKVNFKKFAMQNSFSIILVEKSGQRRVYSTKGVLEKLSVKQVEKALLPKLRPHDIVFFGGYFHIQSLHRGFLGLLKKIRSKNCLVCFDLCFDEYGEWKIFDFLKHVDFLFLNDLELWHLTKKSNEKQAIALLFKNGASNVILKKGAKGSAFFSPCARFIEKAVSVKAVDTTGAGDIFNAAFLKAFFSGIPPKQALCFANFVASEKIKRHGLFVPAQRILKKKLH